MLFRSSAVTQSRIAAFNSTSEKNLMLRSLAIIQRVATCMPPDRAISTVHKAKGLEAGRVIVMPCNSKHFPDNEAARNLLYVAISRATHSLTLVVSRSDPSPLLLV